jgi:hypothetical protein
VREHILQHHIDIIGLQETIKGDFSNQDMRDLEGGLKFSWFWIAAKGRSGGILVGVKIDTLEVEDLISGEFCIQVTIHNRSSKFRWNVITVYGHANHDLSSEFLLELGNICSHGGLPLVMGGDFNLNRSGEEKTLTTLTNP